MDLACHVAALCQTLVPQHAVRQLMMEVKVLFFARARELTGCSEAALSVPVGSETSALPQLLAAAYPALQQVLGSCLLSLNLEYVDADAPRSLKPGDEVGVIPPISGG